MQVTNLSLTPESIDLIGCQEYSMNPKKSKSMTVLMPPEMSDFAKQTAVSHGISVSEFIRILVWNETQENAKRDNDSRDATPKKSVAG